MQIGADGGPADARLRPWWRGRMGYSKAEQQEFFQTQAVPKALQAESSDELDDADTSSGSSSDGDSSSDYASSSSDDAPPPMQ